MSVNFPLILVLATAFTGLVWLLEIYVLRGRRAEKDDEPVIVEYSISFFPVLAIVLVLRSFLYEPFQIPTGSMIPTLEVGDFILVNKYTYGIRLPVIGTKVVAVNEPERGDIMVFIPPHQDEYFIKRVIGIDIRIRRCILMAKSSRRRLSHRYRQSNRNFCCIGKNLAILSI